MCARGLFILLALTTLGTPEHAAPETLRRVLARSGIDSGGLETIKLDRKIFSFAALDDPELFVIAYYADEESGQAGDTLYLDLFRKIPRLWASHELRRGPPDSENPPAFGGAVTRVTRSPDFVYVETHVNPSAGYTLVLKTDLTLHDSIYGWPLGQFADGILLYQNSQVHFAPTHYTEVSVYDPRQKKSWRIYPRPPYQPARLQHIEKVRVAYAKRGPDWFRQNNHHGDPERFDNYLDGPAFINEANYSLIFRLAYDNTDTWDYEQKLKRERFGAFERSLADYPIRAPLPDGAFVSLGQELLSIQSLNLQDAFLDLFKSYPEMQEMIGRALAATADRETDWRKHFHSLDQRWGKTEAWEKLRNALAPPGEATTEVVCIFRNVHREQEVDYREMLWSDFQQRFGNMPLDEYLQPECLKTIFAE